MKILIEIEDEDEARLIVLSQHEMRSRTAQAKKILVEGLRAEYEAKKLGETEDAQ